MNDLDSRFLRLGDTFAQKFVNPGSYAYDLGLPGMPRLRSQEGDFAINVKAAADRRRAGTQHFVVVALHRNRLRPDPPRLDVESGDLVMWSTADPAVPGFSVSGRSGSNAFDSAALAREAVYSHAFGSEGEVEWGDANGHRLGGRISVKLPPSKSDDETLRKTLTEGIVVAIRGQRVEPAGLEILVGQTVFFAVEEASGITITDRRLIAEPIERREP